MPMTNLVSKRCMACDQVLSISEFPRMPKRFRLSSRMRGIYRSTCNSCRPIYAQIQHSRLRSEERALQEALATCFVVPPMELEELAREQNYKCYLCGDWLSEPAQLDHIIPISRGGHHGYCNVALTHAACNYSKGDKDLWRDGWSFSFLPSWFDLTHARREKRIR